jgi:hypothetical protein
MEVIEHADEVAQAAGQLVEFPDNQRIAVLQGLEATEQSRALGVGSYALVLKDFLASGFSSKRRAARRGSGPRSRRGA